MRLSLISLFVLCAMVARAAVANLIYDTTARVVAPTNLIFTQQIISNSTAVRLTGSLTNVTLDGAVLAQPFAYNAGRSSGTNAYFNAGKIVFRDGQVLSFSGGSIACIASRTNYVGVSLRDGALRAWRQAYDDGTVWLAEVVTDGSGITGVQQYSTPRIPPGRIERTKAKLAAGLPANVYVTGSSLVFGTIGSPTNRWLKLLWDGSATVTNYLVTGYATTTVEDRSANSQLMMGNFAFLWPGYTVKALAKYDDNAWLVPHNYATRYDQASVWKAPPSYYQAHDLAIVCGSFNNAPQTGTADKLAWYEATVRELRRRGCEVICVPDHSSSTSPNARWDDNYPIIKAISDAYGCAFADTASAMDYSRASGQSPYVDTVHQNDTGHAAWADAVRGVLNQYRLETDNSRFEIPAKRVASFADSPSYNTNTPNAVDLVFDPTVNTAGSYFSTSQAATNCPAVWLWGRSTSAATIQFNSTGIFVEVCHPRAMGMWLILDATQNFTVEVYTANRGTLIKTVQVDSEGSTPKVIPFLSWEDLQAFPSYTGLESTNAPWRNIHVQLKCVSGTAPYTGNARLLGFAFPTIRHEPLELGNLNLSGTWTMASAFAGAVPVALQSNTDLDGFTFDFEGTGAVVALNADSGSGIVDVYVDGQPYQTGLDLYNAQSGTYNLNILPASAKWPSVQGPGFGRHSVSIRLNGENPSQSGSPLIRVLGATSLDAR